MAYNEQTMARAERTILLERVDRPAREGGARRVFVRVLLPYSIIRVDGVRYVETNSCAAILEGGGAHVPMQYGETVSEQYVSRTLGVASPDVPQGLGQRRPTEIQLHRFGWL